MDIMWNMIGSIATVVVALATICLVGVAYAQFGKSRESQRAAFLSEYISKIFTDKELSDTYHYLVYTYTDGTFVKVCEALNAKGNTEDPIDHKKMYSCLEALQDGREEGLRFYHPEKFQGSVEEKRLDSLLGYFNIIAYYHNKKVLSLDDINGSIGYHLTVMASRNVIKAYLGLIDRSWKERYAQTYGLEQPLLDLKKLLKDVRRKRRTSSCEDVDPATSD